MQKSGVYVLYHKLPGEHGQQDNPAAPAPAKFEYKKVILRRTGRDDNTTRDLDEAVQLDKRTAFAEATKRDDGGPWAVGELVSDAKGVRVEE